MQTSNVRHNVRGQCLVRTYSQRDHSIGLVGDEEIFVSRNDNIIITN